MSEDCSWLKAQETVPMSKEVEGHKAEEATKPSDSVGEWKAIEGSQVANYCPHCGRPWSMPYVPAPWYPRFAWISCNA